MSFQPSAGTIHDIVPDDLLLALRQNKQALEAWEDITPLARNEWICWAEEAKIAKTRALRISRVVPELIEGKRRPCCWIGCIHRTDKAVSASVQAILDKRNST